MDVEAMHHGAPPPDGATLPDGAAFPDGAAPSDGVVLPGGAALADGTGRPRRTASAEKVSITTSRVVSRNTTNQNPEAM
jgi:hypothetical protein